MKNEHNKNLTLAIETAVLGGSISLLRDGLEIDFVSGEKDVSRSEDLLENIDGILKRNNAAPGDINLIAVSTGPGSYTGIRVGIATALGLKNGLGVPCVGVQLFSALTLASRSSGKIVCAVPIGRDEVCRQSFESETPGPIRIEKQDAFFAGIISDADTEFILHEKLFDELSRNETQGYIVNAGGRLARYIGLAADRGEALSDLEPIYIRDNI